MGSQDVGEAFGEDAAGAGEERAEEPTDAQVQGNRNTSEGEIRHTAEVPAMDAT